jgi:hypothetical protein
MDEWWALHELNIIEALGAIKSALYAALRLIQ